MQTLSLETVPLDGTRLIEASAGTGKTFTLTALYLRLLLERGFDVSQLLVVTFTEAATDELRGRVRERLRQAAAAFEAGESEDPVSAALLRRLDDHVACAQQLRDAVTRLDEAAIFTIHGFCQRMLIEHAFESGAVFDSELTTDARTLHEAVIEDFWRTRFYPADAGLAAWVGERWATPAALLDALSPWLHNAAPRVLPAVDEERMTAVEQALQAAWTQARANWDASAIQRLLLEAPGLSRSAVNYRQDRVEELVAEAEAYFAAPERRRFVPQAMARLTPEALAQAMTKTALKEGQEPPKHAFFGCCATLVARARELDVLDEASILGDAAAYLQEGLARRKRDSRQLTFNDLLVDLHAALTGDGGDALADAIRERYPVALVDEFQDTDPLQYRIFERVYGDHAEGAWYLIGDPKQAIYGFRGADIFTYIEARRATDPDTQHYTLGTNWRSAEALIDAVNALFGRASKPFIFDEDIPFRPVAAAGRADRSPLRLEGATPPALQVWSVDAPGDKALAKKLAEPMVTDACAAEIVRLLTLAREGRAQIGERALCAGDIAVLVRTRFQAAAVRHAFEHAGIKSVYMSRDSVFASEEAEALEHVLAAVAEPGADRRVRAALSTHLLGADAQTLDAGEDDPRWLGWLEQFQRHHDEWLRRGFMPFFQRLLQRHRIPERLLASPEGERRLTNLLQLSELAQAASASAWGMTGLLRWLAEQRQHPDGEADEQQLRLESDAGLVKIVTIHKSKGLEYPVVFLPFLWDGKWTRAEAKGRPAPVTFHDPGDRAYTLDLGSAEHEDHHRRHLVESLAEDLRLLYVALTRARHRCYVAWGRIKGADASALGYLLYQPEPGEDAGVEIMDEAAVHAPWHELATTMPEAVAVSALSGAAAGRLGADAAAAAELAARNLGGPVPRGWQMASYSSLTAGLAQGRLQPEAPDHDAVDETAVQPEELAADADAPFAHIIQFPRGARAGTCLHALLERVDFATGTALDGTALPLLTRRVLIRHGFDVRWEPAVSSMVGEVLASELGAGGRLNRVTPPRRLVELEFYFPLERLDAAALNAFLADYRSAPLERPLAFAPLAGLMKGYVDLVFEQDGRYFIADYKSNYLGAQPSDYDPAVLPAVMRHHDYDLQYLIYTVAVCRYLARRLPDFRFDSHFGGVYYLFLRGMQAADARRPGVHFHRADEQTVQALDALLTGAGEP